MFIAQGARSRLGKSPIRRQRIGGVFRIFPLMPARITEVGVSELMGDDPANEVSRPAAEGTLEHDTSAWAFGGGGTNGDLGGGQGRLVIAKMKVRVGEEIAPDMLGQCDHDGCNM